MSIPLSKGESPLKLFLTLFLPVAALIAAGGWYVGQDRIRGEMDLIRKGEIGYVILGVRRLDDELAMPLRQLRALHRSSAVRQAVEGGKSEAMAAVFADLIGYTNLYDKIRWVDETGHERVRVNRVESGPNGVTIQVVDDEALQDVSSAYYFVNAMRLSPGQAYISPMDLNTEQGKVEQPAKPMLRLVAPLQNAAGQPRGVLILNVATRQMLEAFTASLVEARDHAMLVNSDGYWLKSPNQADEWGFMFQRKETLATRNPEAWRQITATPSGQVATADGLWTWSTVYPLKEEGKIADIPRWLVVSHLPQRELNLIGAAVWPQVLGSALGLLFLFGALSAWLTRALAERTQAQVTAAREHTRMLAAQRLNESLERFHLIVEANVNGILAVNSSGIIVLANPALERMFGYERGELQGQPMEALLPESSRAAHTQFRDGYMQAPEARPMGAGRRLTGRRKDGGEFPVEISLSPFTEHGEQFVDAVVVDLSRAG
jgi:PAS domain S-box-containing protein